MKKLRVLFGVIIIGALVFSMYVGYRAFFVKTMVSTHENAVPVETLPAQDSLQHIAAVGCYISGCSQELCSDQNDMLSNCIYKEINICYKTARCERQLDGKCGWTQTQTLTECLNQAF